MSMPPKDAEVEVVEQEPLSVLRCVLFSSLNLCKRAATYFLEYAKDGRMKKGGRHKSILPSSGIRPCSHYTEE